MFSFISVKFLLMMTLVFWLKPCFSLSKLCNLLLFNRAFLLFPVQKMYYCFFDLLLSGFPILWHASTSLGKTLTSMSESTEITVSSKSLSERCAAIPETTILFLLSYCSNALTEDSLDMTSFSSLLHFSYNFLFSSCSLFITTSLSLIISSLRQLIVEIMFSSTLASASLVVIFMSHNISNIGTNW